MTQVQSGPPNVQTTPQQVASYDGRAEKEPTGWVGWITFAGIMMIIGGCLNALYGLVAILNDTWVGWTNTTHVYVSVSTWGWVQLIVGAVVVLCGFGVFSGNVVARTVAVIVAGLSMIANFFFIPVYPLWALTVIVVDALVIWALTAHGSEMRKL